mgnify:CR=1 FL=1
MVRFAHPNLFFLLVFLILLIVLNHFVRKSNQKRFAGLADDSTRRFLFNRILFRRIKFKDGLIFLGIFFMIIAAVGPQIGTRLTELKREGVDVIIALDTSTSMGAVDVKPTRLEKAIYELSRLVNNLKGDKVGLIVFAGTAHMHLPQTTDYAAVRLFLQTVNTNLVQSQGTDLASALALAMEKVKTDDNQYKVIVLVSDGEDHQGKAVELAEEAASMGIIVHTLGVGTAAGGPIPIFGEDGSRVDFKKDRQGNIVTSRLNDAVLNEIAYKTNGKYIRVENQPNAISPLLEEIDEMEKREIKAHVFSQYENRYQIFLIFALICFVIEFLIATRSTKELAWEGRFSR